MSGRKKTEKTPTSPEKRGRGRPATGRKRALSIDVPVTDEEREILQTAAAAAAVPLSQWLRELGLREAGGA